MAIGQLRQFWADLIDEIAKRIKTKTKENYPKTEKTKIAKQRAYMKQHLSLKKENKLIEWGE